MTIKLNGEPHDLDGPVSIKTLLDRLGVDDRRVAVERNAAVVKRAMFESVIVAEGDEIEIVNFVGGGSGPPLPVRGEGRRCQTRW